MSSCFWRGVPPLHPSLLRGGPACRPGDYAKSLGVVLRKPTQYSKIGKKLFFENLKFFEKHFTAAAACLRNTAKLSNPKKLRKIEKKLQPPLWHTLCHATPPPCTCHAPLVALALLKSYAALIFATRPIKFWSTPC